MAEVAVLGAARTAIGGFQGAFSGVAAVNLGGTAIRGALDQAGSPDVDEISMGCVLQAGQGQAPARQAAFNAGLGEQVPATTINKMCGSGMQTVMSACDQLRLGRAQVCVAGGMESMTNAPYLLPRLRAGARLGHAEAKDHMFLDGLEDCYDGGRLMGDFAEECAGKYQFTREEQDEYALASLANARAAQAEGRFTHEITPHQVATRKAVIDIAADEQPQTARPDRIPQLKPAFRKNGTVTAANSSSISDGAAALVLARSDADVGTERVLAVIRGHANHAQAPAWFTTAPITAATKLLDQVGWQVGDVDLWEVNEAFAVVPMAFMRELGLPRDIVNVNGGACALGHPIGASGARIIVTLLHEMTRRDVRRGVAAICIGGGEGTAVALERC